MIQSFQKRFTISWSYTTKQDSSWAILSIWKLTIVENNTENSISDTTWKTASPDSSRINTNVHGRIHTHLLQQPVSVSLTEKLAWERNHKPSWVILRQNIFNITIQLSQRYLFKFIKNYPSSVVSNCCS